MRARTRDSIFVGVAVLLAGFVNGCSQISGPRPTAAFVPVRKSAPLPQKTPRSPQIIEASYYGDEFRGRKTASGERYDPNQLTAASKKIPIGSLVHVTNPENGRSVVVKINDHGPYVRGRSLDLSKAAARRLGLIRKGVGHVKITRIHGPRDSARPTPVKEPESATPRVVPISLPAEPPAATASESPKAESTDAVQ